MAELSDVTRVIQEGNQTNHDMIEKSDQTTHELLVAVVVELESIKDSFNDWVSSWQRSQQAMLERQIEADRANQFIPPSPTSGDQDLPEVEKLSGGFTGLLVGLAALSKIFGGEDWARLPAYTKVFASGWAKVTKFAKDIATFVGSAFNHIAKTSKFLQSFGAGFQAFATKLAPLVTVFKKIALPLTIIFGIFDAIEGFTKAMAVEGATIVDGIRGAISGIIDGFVGGLVRLVGDAVGWILGALGFDALGDMISNTVGRLWDGIMVMVNGVVDTILGVFTLDLGRIGKGLATLASGFIATLTEAIFLPINFVINTVRDIFSFFTGDELTEFRLQDLIMDTFNDIKEWFTGLFDFEMPSFDFDPKAIFRDMLPEPGSWLSKLVPDSVYEWVGESPSKDKRGAEIPSQNGEQTQSEGRVVNADGWKLGNVEQISEKRGMIIPSQNGTQSQQEEPSWWESLRKSTADVVRPNFVNQMTSITTDFETGAMQDIRGGFGTRLADKFEATRYDVADTISGEEAARPHHLTNRRPMDSWGSLAGEGLSNLMGMMPNISNPLAGMGDMVAGGASSLYDSVTGTLSDVGDKLNLTENIIDPVTNFFSGIGDSLSSVLDFSGMMSKIKKYMTNMFAEVGIPRVEFDVPLVGKIGFGPFYPFAPDAGDAQVSSSNKVTSTKEGDKRTKEVDRRHTEIGDVSEGSTIIASQSLTETENGTTDRSRQKAVGKFDYETGKGRLSVTQLVTEKTEEGYKQLEKVVNRYDDLGPLEFGKVRRMVDEGASPQDIEAYIKESRKSITEKVSNFLGFDASQTAEKLNEATSVVGDSVSGAVSDASNFVSSGIDKASSAISSVKEGVMGWFGQKRKEQDLRGDISRVVGGQDEKAAGRLDEYMTKEFGKAQAAADEFLGVYEQSLQRIISDPSIGATKEQKAQAQADLDDFRAKMEPVPNKVLNGPVGEASKDFVNKNSGMGSIIAPVTNNTPITNNQNVTNVNKTTVMSASARPTDSSFARLQNATA